MTVPQLQQQSNSVAFLIGYIPRPLEPFSSIVINGLLSQLHHYGKKLVLYSQVDPMTYDEFCADLLSSRVEGLILVPPRDPALLEKLVSTGIPLVALADRAPGVVSVLVDNETGAFMLAEHLALRGHRRVMYRKDPDSHESAQRRFAAFEKAARFHGMEIISTLPADGTGVISHSEENILLAPKGERPSAAVSWVDTYAYALLRFCKQHHLGVPADLAVAGFDGITPTLDVAQRLTTVQAPWYLGAQKAVDLMARLIQGEEVPREMVLPVDLVLGDTT